MSKKIKAFASVLCLGLSACGGGGGNTPPSPPPVTVVPPPVNAAPTIDIATPDGTAADELQVLTLDASGSSDPENDTLSFVWTQASGPAAVLSAMDTATVTVTLPEVDATQMLTFELTVSDGTNSVMQTVELTDDNIALTPLTTSFVVQAPASQVNFKPQAVWGWPAFTDRPNPSPADSFFGIRQDANGDGFLFVSESDGTTLLSEQTFPFGAMSGEQRIRVDIANLVDDTRQEPFFSFEADNVVRVFQDSSAGTVPVSAGTYDTIAEFAVNSPCQVKNIYLDDPLASFALGQQTYDLLIARRGGGFVYTLNGGAGAGIAGFSPTVTEVIPTGSVCEFQFTNLGGGGFFSDIVGVDVESKEIVTYIKSDTVDYTAGDTTPLNLTAGVEVIDALFFLGQNASATDPLVPLGQVLVLVSDNVHQGNHSLLVYQRDDDPTGATLPTTYSQISSASWPVGVPSSFTTFDAGEDGDFDLIVTLKSAPFAVFLENVAASANADPVYAAPAYFETGFGVSEVTEWTDANGVVGSLALIKSQADEILFVTNGTSPAPPASPKLVIAGPGAAKPEAPKSPPRSEPG